MNKVSQLLDDIEAFSRNGPMERDEPAKRHITREKLAFPDLSQPPPEKAKAVLEGEMPTLEAPSTLGLGSADSLLARLKMQAQDVRKTAALSGAAEARRSQLLSANLGAAFRYLDELVKQLNIIKPPIPKEFIFPGNILFTGLQWADGAADFRMLPTATEDRLYESLSVRLRIAAPRQLRFERDALGVEPMRKLLHDYGIVFQLEEIKNKRNMIERALFTVPCEIRAGFLIKANYQAGTVLLRTRNLDRFGAMEFALQPEDIKQETLDELARLMLGEESRFLKLFRRSA